MERLSPGDLTVLATDRGQVPMHIAAVLTQGSAARLSPEDLAAVLTERRCRRSLGYANASSLPVGGQGARTGRTTRTSTSPTTSPSAG